MASIYPITKPGIGQSPNRLDDALRTAHVPIITVQAVDANTVVVVSNTAGLDAQIATVVTALDPNIRTPGEQQQIDDAAALSVLTAQYAAIKSGIIAVHADFVTINGGPGNPNSVQTGAALKMLANDIDKIATSIGWIADALAGIVRRIT